MKSLKQVLKEFDYGNSLFADPDTIGDATQEEEKYKQWLASKGIEFEDDTDEEYEALFQIARYIEDGAEHNARSAASFISKHGKFLKTKFPEIMDPEHGGKISTLYRGASMPVDAIVQAIGKDAQYQKRIKPGGDLYEYIMLNPSSWYDYIDEFRTKQKPEWGGGWWTAINHNGEAVSRNDQGFLSTTTAQDIAKSFGGGSIIKKIEAKRWSAIISIPFDKVRSRAFINPNWAAYIAEYEESEVWILGDSLPVDKLWVRSPSKTNVSEDSVTVGPIIQALYCRYIDPEAFDTALRSDLTSEKGFDEKSYDRLAKESIILNPRF
jgi:hypothetical protein